ncbi:MAG: sulfatase-like hydrolase/transferase, partial [Bacteroidales bacterium]|nr:sulfatase-like hydrolase/transferase [Bacteroidales bacterium]
MAALAACSSVALRAAEAGCAPGRRPNVIFIMMDDAGHGDFGCYGQTKIETPNIDALARNGILFTDMCTACALSAPSRCCLITGQHTGHAQIRDNKEGSGAPDQANIWDYR